LTADGYDPLYDQLEQILSELTVIASRRDTVGAAARVLYTLSRWSPPGEDIKPANAKQADQTAELCDRLEQMLSAPDVERCRDGTKDVVDFLFSVSWTLPGEYVNPTTRKQAERDLLALRKALSQGGATPTTAQVRLKLPDGSYYGYSGTVEFSQVLVDENTGTVTLRARFANPQSILLPGMFVTAEFAQAVDTSAFLVPQSAISRDPKGNATLFVVGSGNRAVQRVVVADRTQGDYWVVTQGLAAGEKVITQGTANLKDGAQVKPVPAGSPQRVKAPSPEQLKKMSASKGGR